MEGSGRYKWGDAEHERIDFHVMRNPNTYEHKHIFRYEIKTKDLTESAQLALKDFLNMANDPRAKSLDDPDGTVFYIYTMKKEDNSQ